MKKTKLVNLIPSPCTLMGPLRTVRCSLGPVLREPTPLWVWGLGSSRAHLCRLHTRFGAGSPDRTFWFHGNTWKENTSSELFPRDCSAGLNPRAARINDKLKTPYFDISVLMLFATVTMDSNALPDFPAQSPNLRIFQWSETNAQHKNSLAFLQGNMELRPNPEVTFYRPNFQKPRWKWRHQTSAWGCFHVWKTFFF